MENKEISKKQLCDNDLARIEELKRNATPFKVKRDPKSGAAINVAETQDEFELQILKTFGTLDHGLAMEFVQQIGAATPGLDQKNPETTINKVTPLLFGIAPRDELEGMLAVQMVGIHNLSMEMMRRATTKNSSPEAINGVINRVTKLSRTFVAQIEALNRHRSGGKQSMVVEHIHVNEGGQAVIGNVAQREGGGKNEK